MGVGVIAGYAQFLDIERNVLRAAPRRRMHLEHCHLVNNAVTMEITLPDPDAGLR